MSADITITIAGNQGSGKTTVARRIIELLGADGYCVNHKQEGFYVLVSICDDARKRVLVEEILNEEPQFEITAAGLAALEAAATEVSK